MIVCHCRTVTDREIRRAVIDGARTADEVADACGAGTDCGCCRAGVEELLSATICVRRRAQGASRQSAPARTAASDVAAA